MPLFQRSVKLSDSMHRSVLSHSCLRHGLQRIRSCPIPKNRNKSFVRLLSSSSSEPAVDPVTFDKREDVTLIGLNRPHCKNAMNSTMANQLRVMLKSFEDDHSSHVAVLHGNGPDFCAGWDLNELADMVPEKQTMTKMMESGLTGITQKEFRKPVIAALSGHVVGSGLELALACDLRIASPGTTLGGFNRKMGVPFMDGCTVRLPALIGLSQALDLILTGRLLDVQEAVHMGLINRVSEGDLLTDAFELAKGISQHPKMCMLTDRQSAYHSTYDAASLRDALHHEFENAWKVLPVDSIKGAKKFVERKQK